MPQPTIQVTVRLPMPLYDALLVQYGDQTALSGMVLRALESALGHATIGKGTVASAPSTEGPAQTRTPEESNTSVPDVPAGGKMPKGEGQKEVVQDRPKAGTTSPQRALGTPRRSADSKKGVKPIQRTT